MSISDPCEDDEPATQPRQNGTGTLRSPREATSALNPSRPERLLIILSFPVLFLLAVPFWWYTTSIERLPLPTARIQALSLKAPPVLHSTILLTADDAAYPAPAPGRQQYTSQDVCTNIAKEVRKGIDGIYDRPHTKGKRHWNFAYEETRRERHALRIHLKVSEQANRSYPLEPYVQPPEAAFQSNIQPGTLVVPVHPNQVSDRFLHQHYKIALINSLLALYPSEPPEIPLRALKYSPNITLSFVLLNEDSTDGSYVRSWDVDGAIRDHFLPHLEPLRSTFNFSIESQVLHHAPLSFEPVYGDSVTGVSEQIAIQQAVEQAGSGDGGAEHAAQVLIQNQNQRAWLVDEEGMKVFVNTEQWTLDSGSSNNPVLRFLLFVPSKRHRPMKLGLPDTAPSFLLPQFGAVAILNPPSVDVGHKGALHLPSTALLPSFHLFTQHLYALLALPEMPAKIHPSPPPSPLLPASPLVEPLSRWQVETVYRQRMAENSDEARKTLSGIVRLVDKIKEMKVGEGVREMVISAVEKLEQLDKTTDPLQAFILSRDAVALANQAFFDPSMMGLLYFPNEHKFAVYTPLFVPVAIPIVVGLLKEIVAYAKRRRRPAVDGDTTM